MNLYHFCWLIYHRENGIKWIRWWNFNAEVHGNQRLGLQWNETWLGEFIWVMMKTFCLAINFVKFLSLIFTISDDHGENVKTCPNFFQCILFSGGRCQHSYSRILQLVDTQPLNLEHVFTQHPMQTFFEFMNWYKTVN